MDNLIVVFAAVYALKIIPAFAPRKWVFLSLVGFKYPELNLLSLALIASFASTLGRMTLAKLSQHIIRNKFLSAQAKDNIDVIKSALEQRKNQTVGALLIYSLTPLPSNYLYIAYGLTALPIKLIAFPFFFGRFVSYSGSIFLGQQTYKHVDIDANLLGDYLSVYYFLTQIAVLLLVYLFTKVDWRVMIDEKKLKWHKAKGPHS